MYQPRLFDQTAAASSFNKPVAQSYVCLRKLSTANDKNRDLPIEEYLKGNKDGYLQRMLSTYDEKLLLATIAIYSTREEAIKYLQYNCGSFYRESIYVLQANISKEELKQAIFAGQFYAHIIQAENGYDLIMQQQDKNHAIKFIPGQACLDKKPLVIKDTAASSAPACPC